MGEIEKKKRSRQHAMWLVAYIRVAGYQPVQFAHATYQSYVADLQRRYDCLRTSLGAERLRQAKLLSGRLLELKGMR
jgi:hypothetical protein